MNLQLFSKIKSTTKLSLIFVFFSLILFNNYEGFAQKKDFVVVLDAGHGGWEPGKVGLKKIKEKDITLKIVLKLGELLEKENNIKVIYTRKTDVYIGLKERGAISNKADANLFISIHCNAWKTGTPNGFETYVLGLHKNKENFEVAKAENSVILLEENYEEKYKRFDPNSPESFIGLTLMQEEYLDQSIQLASLVQNSLVKNLSRRDRGVKQAGFMVLHQTYMPSILIEGGFLTNSKDVSLLSSTTGQNKIADAVYKGVKKYINQLSINTVADTQQTKNKPKTVDSDNLDKTIKNVQFKVQIAAGSRKLETKSYNFKGLKNVERIKSGKTYRYYFGKTANYIKIKEFQRVAKSKGYQSAFIVAFKKGKKISIEDVLKKS